jgi:hypothetical protein
MILKVHDIVGGDGDNLLFLRSVGWSDKLINILYHLSFQGLFFFKLAIIIIII